MRNRKDVNRAGTDPRGVGKYTSDDFGLRTKLPYEETVSPRDIYKNVVKNSLDDDAGGSRPGPIKYGVD